MLTIMTESEEPVLRAATNQRGDLKDLRTCGTVALLAGGMLTVAAFVFSKGEPSWKVLGIFVMEAAIRERGRS